MTSEPKIVRSTWANVYPEWVQAAPNSRNSAETLAMKGRIAILRRDFYEDGACKVTIEEDV